MTGCFEGHYLTESFLEMILCDHMTLTRIWTKLDQIYLTQSIPDIWRSDVPSFQWADGPRTGGWDFFFNKNFVLSPNLETRESENEIN